MPNLEDLFKERIIDRGPNQGKTAEEAYAIRDSKARDISSSNPFINAVAASGGGPAKLFDVIGVLNKRRKGSIRLSESPSEVEQMGLRQFAISGRPFIYGGDIFRITNQRTRTFTLMNSAVGRGSNGGIDDKIGNAVGNYASDAVTNLLSGKQIPPKPDLVAIGTELAIDVADRALGALLPNPMVPTKVADEFEKGRGKKKVDFIDEFDTPKKILKLNSQKKVPKFIDGLLKNNKNILSQTKDFLISTAASVVGGLVKAGATALVRGATNAIVGQKLSNILLGPQANNSTNPNIGLLRYSSRTPYSKVNAFEFFKPLDEQVGLKGRFFQQIVTEVKNKGIKLNLPAGSTGDAAIIAAINREPKNASVVYHTVTKTSMFALRGMSSKGDMLNLSDDITYDGTTVLDNTTVRTLDSFDFIALKFYSIYQNKTVQFRCTVSELSETFAPTWSPNKFIGNPFNFYTYQGVERSLTFSFKVFSLNLYEHINAWERLNFLAKLTYPQDYKGASGAVAPPLIKFTLGNMYDRKDAFIESLTFTVDTNTPWEIGMNSQLSNGQITKVQNGGYTTVIDTSVSAEDFKLPMIINVEVTLKFIESRGTTSKEIYGFQPPVRTAGP
jgi:hypothetical protein